MASRDTTTVAGTDRAAHPRGAPPGEAATQARAGRPSTGWSLPAFVLFFLFHTIPVLQGIFYSFTDYAGYGTWEFVGFKNYDNLFQDDRIRDSYCSRSSSPSSPRSSSTSSSLAIAVGLNARSSSATAFRGIFFIPNVLSDPHRRLHLQLPVRQLAAVRSARSSASTGCRRTSSPTRTSPGSASSSSPSGRRRPSPSSSTSPACRRSPASSTRRRRSTARARGGSSARSPSRCIAAFFTINMVLSLKDFLMVFDLIVALTNGGPGTSTESISLRHLPRRLRGRRVRLPDGQRRHLLHRDRRLLDRPAA